MALWKMYVQIVLCCSLAQVVFSHMSGRSRYEALPKRSPEIAQSCVREEIATTQRCVHPSEIYLCSIDGTATLCSLNEIEFVF